MDKEKQNAALGGLNPSEEVKVVRMMTLTSTSTRWLKGSALALAGLSGLVLLALLFGPLFFKDDLRRLLVDQLNQQVEAEVRIGEVSLSFFRHFPHPTLVVEDFRIQDQDAFPNSALLSGAELAVSLNLFSVLNRRRPIELIRVHLLEPKIHLIVLRDGTTNYDIFSSHTGSPTSEPADSAAAFAIELRSYRLQEGALTYEDHAAETYVSLEGLDHQGSGSFGSGPFELSTSTEVRTLTVQQSGITYLREGRLDWQGDFMIDPTDQRYGLLDQRLFLNAFPLHLDGYVQQLGEHWQVDLAFSAPEGSFKDFLSLIPQAYSDSFSSVEASGRLAFDGNLRGLYEADAERYPSFVFNLQVEDGRLQYPDLPRALTDVELEAHLRNRHADLDSMEVMMPRFAFRLGNDPFRGRFSLRTPLSDPDLQAQMEGTIDLNTWQEVFPLEQVQQLAGILRADLALDTRLSTVEAGRYEQVTARGGLELEGLRYQADGQPLVSTDRMALTLDPQRIRLAPAYLRLGQDVLQLQGELSRYLAYFTPEASMEGNLRLRAPSLDLRPWMPAERFDETDAVVDTTTSPGKGFDRFRLGLDVAVSSLLYDTLELSDLVVRGLLAPNRLQLDALELRMRESDLSARGTLEGMMDYLQGEGLVSGQVTVRSRFLDLNAFMTESSEAAAPAAAETDALSPLLLPERVHLDMDLQADRLLYGHFDLRQVRANLRLDRQNLLIEEAAASTLGGKLALQGAYDTRTPDDPRFKLKVEMERFDFQSAFTTINTFALLAPVGQFVDGTFNAQLSMDGALQPDMMPAWNTLNARGYLETLNGVIGRFGPLQSIAAAVRLPALSQPWRITDTRNGFEVENGLLRVQPFDIVVQDIPLTISGYHGLTNRRMDYDIRARIPRRMLAQGSIGSAADRGLSLLEEQAARLGLEVQPGGDVLVGISLTGALQQPEVGVRLLGTAEPEDEGPSAADTSRRPGANLREEGQALLDTLTEDPEGTLRELLDSTTVDDIREGLQRWNPFRRRDTTHQQDSQ